MGDMPFTWVTYVWHDSLYRWYIIHIGEIGVIWLIHLGDIPFTWVTYVWHDSFTWVVYQLHRRNMSDMTRVLLSHPRQWPICHPHIHHNDTWQWPIHHNDTWQQHTSVLLSHTCQWHMVHCRGSLWCAWHMVHCRGSLWCVCDYDMSNMTRMLLSHPWQWPICHPHIHHNDTYVTCDMTLSQGWYIIHIGQTCVSWLVC